MQGPEDAPAEPAATEGPGSVHQGAALTKRPRTRVSTASAARTSHPAPHHANVPTRVPPSCSSLHPPVPQVVLAVSAGEMGGAHAEAAQHTGAAVHTATLDRECTYEGRLGVSWELSELSARRGHEEIATGRQ